MISLPVTNTQNSPNIYSSNPRNTLYKSSTYAPNQFSSPRQNTLDNSLLSNRSIQNPLTSRYQTQNDLGTQDNSSIYHSPRFQPPERLKKSQTLPPLVLASRLRSQKMEDKHLMGYLSQQNNMLEILSSRIGQQQRDYMEKQRRDLQEKLKMLEMENALKLQEYELLEMEAQDQTKKPKEKPKKKKKKGTDFTDLLEKVMFKKTFKDLPADLFGKMIGKDKNRDDENELEDYYGNHPPGYHPSYQENIFQHSNRMYDPYQNQYDTNYSTRNDYYPGMQRDYRPPPSDNRSIYGYAEPPTKPSGKTPKANKSGNAKSLKKIDTRKNLDAEDEADEAVEEDDAPKKKNVKSNRKTAARSNLRKFLWGITYPNLLKKDVDKKVEEKKLKIHAEMSNMINDNFNYLQEWLIKESGKALTDLITEKRTLELYNKDKPVPDREVDPRILCIMINIKQVFDKLTNATNPKLMNKNLIRFLAFMSEDNGVLPNDFMFDFEIKRLQFTYYGTLKGMNVLKSKMILSCFVLLRVLVHKLIMRPWQCYPIEESNVKKGNLMTIGSVLYHVVMDLFRNNSNLPVLKNNQVFLHAGLRVRARPNHLRAQDITDINEEDSPQKTDKNKEIEPILGFYTKEQLSCFFAKRPKRYEDMKKMIETWIDKMYDVTHDLYEKTPKEQRETLGLPK